jgi:hypothetical protein
LTELLILTTITILVLSVFERFHANWIFDLKYLTKAPEDASERAREFVFQEIIFAVLATPAFLALGRIVKVVQLGEPWSATYALPLAAFGLLALVRFFRHIKI